MDILSILGRLSKWLLPWMDWRLYDNWYAIYIEYTAWYVFPWILNVTDLKF